MLWCLRYVDATGGQPAPAPIRKHLPGSERYPARCPEFYPRWGQFTFYLQPLTARNPNRKCYGRTQYPARKPAGKEHIEGSRGVVSQAHRLLNAGTWAAGSRTCSGSLRQFCTAHLAMAVARIESGLSGANIGNVLRSPYGGERKLGRGYANELN